ncbi:hypothetical protein AB1Y20_015556 [Prymnesium parvum]|uniref:Uncharacterized protein n=1 Tax=Prymnesium parvum TaxID=97485 RepID=A0AB34JYU4_PRYPA
MEASALLALRQRDRAAFLEQLKASGLTKLGERLRYEQQLLAPPPPADVLSAARAHGECLLALRDLSRRDHAAFTRRCEAIGLRTLGERVQLEQTLRRLPAGALHTPAPRALAAGAARVHYVIASFEGYTKRTHYYPPPGKVLCLHLDQLCALSHALAQVTVVQAESSGCARTTAGYYSSCKHHFEGNPLVQVQRCENYGYSMGQWLKVYETYRDAFDYYLFMEDDYCPTMHHFDATLVRIYQRKFPNNVGLLCSVVQGSKAYDGPHGSRGCFPIHWEGSVFVSSETLRKLYECPRWAGDPRGWMDRLTSTEAACLDAMRKDYLGGYYQLTFSLLFTRIEHEDYLDVDSGPFGGVPGKPFCFPYWCDRLGLYFIHRGDIKKKKYTLEQVRASLIAPVQIIDEEGLRVNATLDLERERNPDANDTTELS